MCRRRRERLDLVRMTNEALDALNFLGGWTEDAGSGCVPPSNMQREVMARAEDLACLVMRARADAPSRQAAFRGLLQGKAGYDLDLAHATLAPFHMDRVSLPSNLDGAPDIRSVLADADRSLVEVEDQPFLTLLKPGSG